LQINSTQTLTVSKQLYVNPSDIQDILANALAPARHLLLFWARRGNTLSLIKR